MDNQITDLSLFNASCDAIALSGNMRLKSPASGVHDL